MNPLDEQQIREYLSIMGDHTPIQLHLLDSIASTNDYFKGKPKTGLVEFCFAETQTQGRGRLGRTWHSPTGINITVSCRWPIPENIETLNGLSSCVSLSILSALRPIITGLVCKWPNDVYYHDKKLAGILIELNAEMSRLSEAIIGIGLNVNMDESMLSDVFIEKPWTSIQNILGFEQDRNYIAALLLHSLSRYLRRFTERGFTDFLKEWEQCDYLHGKSVTLSAGENNITGIASGINSSGHLLVQMPSGETIAYSSGEIQR